MQPIKRIAKNSGAVMLLAMVAMMFTACSAPSAGSGGSSYSAPASTSAGSDPAPAAPTPAPRQSTAPKLMAGVIDDNAAYNDYLSYAADYPAGYTIAMNMTDRRIIKVTDSDGAPIADALVKLNLGEQTLFRGRTTSDGRLVIFPHTIAGAGANRRDLVATRNGASATATLDLGAAATKPTTIVLDHQAKLNGLDVVFLLDSTDSMADEIDRIKQTIFSISQRIGQLPGAPHLRLGLVTYRDRNDDYVSKHWDFTTDVAAFSRNLNSIEAGGGGDIPEDFNAGLSDTLSQLSWNAEQQPNLRLVFAVSDAAPHTDYADETQYDALLRQAVGMGIKVFPIGASGLENEGEYSYRQMAAYTLAKFVFLTYANGSDGPAGKNTDLTVGQYSVANLDDLVVNLVAAEVANQSGNFAPQQAAPFITNSTVPGSEPAGKGGTLIAIALCLIAALLPFAILLAMQMQRWGQHQQWASLRRDQEVKAALAAPASFRIMPAPSYWASEWESEPTGLMKE